MAGQALIPACDGPRSQICGRPATEVDHVVLVAGGGTDSRSGLRSRYHEHHAARHAER